MVRALTYQCFRASATRNLLIGQGSVRKEDGQEQEAYLLDNIEHPCRNRMEEDPSFERVFASDFAGLRYATAVRAVRIGIVIKVVALSGQQDGLPLPRVQL